MRRDIPPLGLFKTFEVAARRLSFTRAADELCVTQGAVSRQIRSLEEQIGAALFKRLHRTIELTQEGKSLQKVVTTCLDSLDLCVQEIRQDQLVQQLTVTTSVAFAYFWLMPRLEKFSMAHPDIDLRVLASDQPVNLSRDNVDIAIHFGPVPPSGTRSEFLLGECVYPVCSPDYLSQHSVKTPVDILQTTLLHLEGGGTIWGSVDWPVWLKFHGVDTPPPKPGIRVNSYPMIIQAAQAGRGVALGWSYIVDEMVADGRLAKPLNLMMKTQNNYYLTSSDSASNDGLITDFKNWILEETEGLRP